MNTEQLNRLEESLDPANWDEMRALGHRMVDEMLAYLETLRDRPVWQPIPGEVRARFTTPIPHAPAGGEAAYEDFRRDVLAYPMGNIHPRFWGWVMGSGTVMGMLADMLAAGLNSNVGGGEHAANLVEKQVIDWCKEMLGYPAEASGVLVSGGSMANLVGLAVARNARAGFDIRKQGLLEGGKQFTLYASQEVHSSNKKAVETLGIGREFLRLIPVDADYRINLTALQAAIDADRAAGFEPLCIIGCAGTVNTGSCDDLDALADIAEHENLWFHVDGAFGALVALSADHRHLVKGMERADSLAFDMHKWMYLPFEAACVLVRDRKTHYRAFTLTPEYLTHFTRGVAAGDEWFSDYGLQLSRGFKALKIWMSIKEHGIDRFGRLIAQNILQAGYFAAQVDAHPLLERLAPAPLHIVCFRFNPGGMSDDALNTLNRELMLQIHERGIAIPTYTDLGGIFALRVCITNHRTRRADLDFFLAELVDLAGELAQSI